MTPVAPPVPDGVVATVMVPVAPEASAPPKARWPAFDHPTTASIAWDSQGLTITAANSSLKQILRDVGAATGLKVEGLTADERVFGVYGPGLARDVLSQVLQGSSYNVIMIGDLGQGAPRRMMLSIRQAANNAPAARPAPAEGGDDTEEEGVPDEPEQPEPQETVPYRPGFQPGGPPRTPQQIMQEMQQRQLQMQQEQEQQQQQDQQQQQQQEQPQQQDQQTPQN